MSAGLVAGLLPGRVETVQRPGGSEGGSRLLPAEEVVLAGSSAGRRSEFTVGRACAREALGRLGVAPAALLPGDRGAPTWPAGVVGSLTHCPGLIAAAVARSTEVAGIGIDAEPHAPLPAGVLDVVARPAEQAHLERCSAADPGLAWDRLLFSAKESVYKVWSPATGLWLDFGEVEVALATGGTFTARLLRPGLVLRGRTVHELAGRWATTPQHVATAIAVVG